MKQTLASVYPSSVAYAENFHRGVSFSGIWWSFACDVRSLWRHNLSSYSCFQTNILAKFVDIICTFFYTQSPYFMCHCTEYKLSALHVRISEENKLNVATQEFITAKFGCVLKKGSKTHSSLRQSNLQLQNEAALMSRRVRAVEHRSAAGLPGAHPALQDRVLLNYTAGLPTCLHQKSQILSQKSQKNPNSSFEAYTHKTSTTAHKTDIKTRQEYGYNTSPIFRSIFFPRNYVVVSVVNLFLSITSIIFRATVKFLQYFVHPAW